jgi:hypothetical protein
MTLISWAQRRSATLQRMQCHYQGRSRHVAICCVPHRLCRCCVARRRPSSQAPPNASRRTCGDSQKWTPLLALRDETASCLTHGAAHRSDGESRKDGLDAPGLPHGYARRPLPLAPGSRGDSGIALIVAGSPSPSPTNGARMARAPLARPRSDQQQMMALRAVSLRAPTALPEPDLISAGSDQQVHSF